MNKYFQIAFFIILVGGSMILFARLGLRWQWVCVQESHALWVGMLGVCVFCIGYGFILAGVLLGKEE